MTKMKLWRRKCLNRKGANGTASRTGLRLRFDSNVDNELREGLKRFAVWLRQEYEFPIRVPVYVKGSDQIRAMDGEMVAGTFFGPFDREEEPYIKIAAGEFGSERTVRGHREAIYDFCAALAHELTHYYQWLNDASTTERGMEWQASYYSTRIVYGSIESTDDIESRV